MKRFINIYKSNNTAGIAFHTAISKVFRKAETLSNEMVEAIEYKNIEKRYLNSEELIRLMSEVHKVFDLENPQGADIAMQKYCVHNINLLTKINLRNDKELAITLVQSFSEVANMWDAYQAPTES